MEVQHEVNLLFHGVGHLAEKDGAAVGRGVSCIVAADVNVDEGVAAQLVVGAAADAAAAAVAGVAQDREGRTSPPFLYSSAASTTFQLVLGHVRMDLAQSVVKGLLGEETGLAHHFLLIGGLVHAQVDEQVAAVDDLAAGLNGGTDLLIEGVRAML
jgi:hypothetical protein